jgi:hypothetical protein
MGNAAQTRSNLFALPTAQPAQDALAEKVDRLESLVEQMAAVVLADREEPERAPAEPSRPASTASSPGLLERAANSLRDAIYD